MGQSAHPGRGRQVGGSALTGVAVLVAAMTVAGCGTSVSASPTTLQRVVDVSVVHPNGVVVPGVDGLRLHRGDVVRTGSAGRVDLVTQSRVVYVGSDAVDEVADGARQQLRHGAVVVDAESGPGLALQVAGLVVTAPHGTAVRAERAVTVRVGTLVGSTKVDSDTGRQLTIPALMQAVVGGDALPDGTTPLRLTDDDGEAHAAPALVRDDEALNALAVGIDDTGAATTRVVEAAWNRPLDALPLSAARSEGVLPVVIAAAGKPADASARYQRAVGMRTAGGSWGVVAHLLNTDAAAVNAVLADFERTQPTGHIGSILAAAVGGSPASAPGDSARRQPSPGPTGDGGASGHPSPTPSPSEQPSGPVETVTSTVSGVVGQVLSILPTPSAATGSTPGPLPSVVASLVPPLLKP